MVRGVRFPPKSTSRSGLPSSDDIRIRRQSVQVRWHRQRQQGEPRKPIRQRFRRCHSPHRRSAAGAARLVRQSHHGHLSIALLAALRGFHLARRRGSQLCRSRRPAAEMDHLSRCGYLPARGIGGAALPHQFADAARHDLRQASQEPGRRPGGRFSPRGPRLFRHRHTIAGDVYFSGSVERENWDDLAEAARWSHGNAATLVDNHWIGGDPAKLEPYGWAAWSAAKGILTLRNPSDKPQTFSFDVQKALELPPGAPQRYRASSPWKSDTGREPVTLQAGTPHEFPMAPFEVITLELK